MKKSAFLTLTTGVVLGLSIGISSSVLAKKEPSSDLQLPTQQLQTLTEVYGRIKAVYVDDVKGDKLIEDAIRGMLTGLDPHSGYMDKKEFADMQEATTGKFGGLGIEVTMEDGFIKVVSPIDDTPAERAGVKAGDLIYKLDDKPVKGMKLSEAVEMMRGDPKTDITLSIVREGEAKPVVLTLTRAIIKVRSIKSRTLLPDYGYIRITQFQERTNNDLKNAIKELQKQNPNLRGIVLDLRNNPGGLLTAAVGVSDAFLDKGTIVSIKGRNEGDQLAYQAESIFKGDLTGGIPIVVLINGGSASASEIVAGALQDHGRAIILGSKSFGKGSVQTITPLYHGDALKLTTARYYTPSGRSIQAKGIEPDVPLARVKVEIIDTKGLENISEAQLTGHLKGESEQAKKAEKALGEDGKEKTEAEKSLELIKNDYQIYEALNLLKGLNVTRALQK